FPLRRRLARWPRYLIAAWSAQFGAIAGFSAVFPFLPFYIRELGITDLKEVELWTGVLTFSSAVAMALIAPFWGWVADRRGRKLMVVRATFGGAVVMSAMALVANVQQLFILRMFQGLLTGTISAFMALVTSFVPETEAGFALGMMQMAVYAGNTLGPLIGGLSADHLGYRGTFVLTGMLLFLAGLLTVFGIKEPIQRGESPSTQGNLITQASAIIHQSQVFAVMLVIGGFYIANAIIVPTLPLFIESLLGAGTMINTNTGTIYGLRALTSALAAGVIGRMADRLGSWPLMILSLAGAAVSLVGQALAPNYAVLIISSLAAGLFIGGLLPSANAILARLASPDQRGMVFGFSSSINAFGNALGPILGASIAGAWGLRASFWLAAGLLGALSIWAGTAIRQADPPRRPRG
ncbi:MAG: MFS transporter, partial [Anaerolineae bacterium]